MVSKNCKLNPGYNRPYKYDLRYFCNMKQMLKLKSIILLLLLPLFAVAQPDKLEIPVETETGLIRFKEVVDEEGTKDELFNRCVYWLNDFYKDPTRITTIRDVPTGKIVGQHQFRVYYYLEDSIKKAGGMVKYTFAIEFKDNKYRYTIDKLLLKAQTNVPVEKWLNKDDPAYDTRWDDYLQQIAVYVQEWSSSLKEKMKPEPEKAKDDW